LAPDLRWGSKVIGERPAEVPFRAHVELLQLFLAHRSEAAEKIQALLNAQNRPVEYLQNAVLLARHFEDCFFFLTAINPAQLPLRGQLQAVHWASGFKPRDMPGLHNDLIDPAQMMIRGFHLWRQTRWPGRHARVRYAHTLFNLYLVRCLELLIMRLWDAGPEAAADRLAQVQGLLDRLWKGSPTDQPPLVRDARWLIPLAQSPTTEELAPYFEVAEQIAASLSEQDRIEIHKASVQMAGGHLRSQLRHYCMKNAVAIDEIKLVLITRNSNALDFAILVQGLVPLLTAYERACHCGNRQERLTLASAICQGVSADPELFVNRVDLLGAYAMIEYLFITDHEAQVSYTAMGRRHVRLLQEYGELMSRLSMLLHEDCATFRPAAGTYSPYGVIFGFSSNLTEHMALKTLTPDAVTDFSVEDVFAEGDAGGNKLAWVDGWRKLPHIKEEVRRLFDYPQRFAEDIFARIEHALGEVPSQDETKSRVQVGRLLILPAGDPEAARLGSGVAELAVRYILSSDTELVAGHKAHFYDQVHLLHDRQEGMFALSYQTSNGWVALTKDFFTEVLGVGQDAKLIGLPDVPAAVLKLMCPNLRIGPSS
jgi:hypothetical protein